MSMNQLILIAQVVAEDSVMPPESLRTAVDGPLLQAVAAAQGALRALGARAVELDWAVTGSALLVGDHAVYAGRGWNECGGDVHAGAALLGAHAAQEPDPEDSAPFEALLHGGLLVTPGELRLVATGAYSKERFVSEPLGTARLGRVGSSPGALLADA